MKYVSTRGQAAPISFFDAVLAGLAPDGGLYVPQTWPVLPQSAVRLASVGHYTAAASAVLKAFAGDDLDWQEAQTIVNAAYLGASAGGTARFPLAVTPLVQTGPGDWLLELFHGPSLAFKDVAMQLIAPLYEAALRRADQRLSVVCATSGDTGGAAVEALKNHPRIDLFVLLPKGRVSEVQQRFMTASGADNVHPLLIDGDFDVCQDLVKRLFADADFARRASLSGVNSINWARIAAQAVYYVVAASALSSAGPVNFAVPTGNLGDAFAGWVAKRLGAPIGRILIATNANDILARALNLGRYERAARSKATISPAMDIQVASNFERLLYVALDGDSEAVRALYESFAQGGGFDVPDDAIDAIRADFSARAVSDSEAEAAIRHTYQDSGRLLCPHTAVAAFAAHEARDVIGAPLVTLATAHPAKFPDAVEAACGVRPSLPPAAANLYARPERYDDMAADIDALKRVIADKSRAWA